MTTSSCFHVTQVEEIKRIVGEGLYERDIVGPDGSPVSGGSALPTTAAWSTTWDTADYKDMGSYTVAGALALVSSDTGSVRGGCTQAVLIANGSNVPTLDGTAATSFGYVNTNGSRNLVQLYRAGDAKFWSCGAYTGVALSIPTAPSWPSAPTIGAAVVGSSVSVTGAATGTAPITYTYQWTLDGTAISGATASSYTPVAGDATHALRCVVTATNAHGSADGTSNAATVSAAATAPDAPTGLTLGTATSSTQPLTWSAPVSNGGAAITDYVIQSSPAGANTWTTFADGTSTTASATVTGLSASTAYDYRVAAINSVGQGAYSSTVTGSTAAGVSALRMTTVTNMTESGTGPYSYTSGSGANSTNTHAGAPNLSLASSADGEAIATITAMPSGFAGIGFGTTSTSGAYTSFLYLLYANSNLTGTGTYRVGLSGAAGVAGNGAETATVPAVGDRLRVRRAGTAVHLEVARSATPDTWLTIHTVTGASTAQLYPRITASVAGSAIELTSFSGLT